MPRRTPTSLLIAGLVAVTLVWAPTAVADPGDLGDPTGPTSLSDATAQAQALRAEVERLEHQVERAAEDHSAATERLGAVISAEIAADAELEAARSSGQVQRGEAARRARALYMSGGNAGMMATLLNGSLLDSGDLGDVLASLRAVRIIVAVDAAEVDGADVQLETAVASSEAVQDLRAQRHALEAQAAEAATTAEESLAAHAGLLAETDAAVVALAFGQRRQEEADALARAGVTVAALGALPSAAAPNQAADRAVQAADEVLGSPYRWGAVGPGTFDCSGLTSWAYRQAGVSIPRTSRAQYAALPKVPLDQLAPGDLVFWAHGSDPSSIHHVGIYVGEGRMVHAPRTGDVVKVSALWGGIYGAVRPVTGWPHGPATRSDAVSRLAWGQRHDTKDTDRGGGHPGRRGARHGTGGSVPARGAAPALAWVRVLARRRPDARPADRHPRARRHHGGGDLGRRPARLEGGRPAPGSPSEGARHHLEGVAANLEVGDHPEPLEVALVVPRHPALVPRRRDEAAALVGPQQLHADPRLLGQLADPHRPRHRLLLPHLTDVTTSISNYSSTTCNRWMTVVV